MPNSFFNLSKVNFRIAGLNAAALLPVDHLRFVKGVYNIIELWIRRNNLFLRRADFLLLFLRRSGSIAYIDQVTDFILLYSTVQKHRNPMLLIHVIGREDSLFLYQYVPQHHIVYFQVEGIDISFSGKSQLIPAYAHGQRKPLPVVAVAEDSTGVILRPEVLRCGFVFPFYIGKNLFTHSYVLLFPAASPAASP